MPLVPNLLERIVLLRLNRGPGLLLDLVGAAGTRAVATALDAGVFEALNGDPQSVEELAADRGLDADALAALLDFLETLGYVEQRGERYALTALSRRWLTDAEGSDFGPYLAMWNDLIFPFWDAELGRTLEDGEPSRTIYEWFDEQPARWQTAQEGFRAVGEFAAGKLVDAVSVPDDAERLLDVGGGHGSYSVAFCEAHPGLTATVLDVPDVEAVVAETVADAGMADRVTFRGGDYTEPSDLGAEFDVALLCNVIHAHDAAETRALFEGARGALVDGGRIVVLDQFAGAARTRTMKAALQFIRLNYVTTLGGTVHDLDDVRKWLTAAGFVDVESKSAGPGTTALVATAAGTGSR